MLTIGIEYLTGYAVATDAANRDKPEWPPHPARVFMAMAAAYFETGEASEDRAALLFLENINSPPLVAASAADTREPVVHYVPVNGDRASDVGSPMLRHRQARGFPRVRPYEPMTYLIWENVTVSESNLAAINTLCGKVARIGHSSSLVQMWAFDAAPQLSELHNRHVPDEFEFQFQARTFGQGSLEELRRRFRADDAAEFAQLTHDIGAGKGNAEKTAKALRKEKFNDLPPRPIRPEFRLVVGYRKEEAPKPEARTTVWDSRLLILGLNPMETAHRRLDIRAGAAVARALRDALMKTADGQRMVIPEILSGHKPGGTPSESPHCAFIPLSFVGRRHADGHLMGIAVAFPAKIEPLLRRQIAGLLAIAPPLTLGNLGKWELLRGSNLPDQTNLQPGSWCGGASGSREWATVTPIACDNHAKSKDLAGRLQETAEMVARACERIGLPVPESIRVSSVSVHEGAPTAYEFPRLSRKDGTLRRQTHARLRFAEPVVGPVLLGAGRYRGYGICRPCREEDK